ncbi:MAG: hypothetical protein ACJ763_18135 [Bdellovibrionia bacterium]
MKASLRHRIGSVKWLTLMLGAGGAWLGVAGCSTTNTLSPHEPAKEVALPAYAYLPHPAGHTTGDVISLFTERGAPSRVTMAKCEDEFRTLYSKAQSIEERTKGVRELVSRNPAAYHWCFYSQILGLEEGLSQDEFVDQKQKRVMTTYEYLVPVARAFMKEFQDSRYLRWAIQDYRRLADLYFYRKLEMSPHMSSELVDVAVPVDERSSARNEGAAQDAKKMSVLEKYKIGNALPESSVLVQAKQQADDESAAIPKKAELPPPVVEAVAEKKEEPAEPAVTDPDVQDTIQTAMELARQRKETATQNRAPAGKVESAPAMIPAQALVPAPAVVPVAAPVTAPVAAPAPKVVSPVTEPPKEELPAIE